MRCSLQNRRLNDIICTAYDQPWCVGGEQLQEKSEEKCKSNVREVHSKDWGFLSWEVQSIYPGRDGGSFTELVCSGMTTKEDQTSNE
jgi:hypothetical protein